MVVGVVVAGALVVGGGAVLGGGVVVVVGAVATTVRVAVDEIASPSVTALTSNSSTRLLTRSATAKVWLEVSRSI